MSGTHKGWTIYLVVYFVMFVVFASFTFSDNNLGQVFSTLFVFSTLLDVISLIGLFKYARTRTVSYSMIWVIIAAFFTAKLLFTWSKLIPNLYPWFSTPEQKVSLAGLAGALLQVPVAYALWRYSFRKG